ncbi:tail fiber assembly protein [Pseudomonas sp. HMWF021]|uniref:tail fiber assembly protein n=1 Tax=Pseudomonas sp. HMWF021 TaxID=2056857 RepID=UPI000D3A2BE7|nr:tail fiber assembly protein [Pseudomonas sp. HMWF021]PTT31887.1 hypothetical protein DBR18_05745 [Pseudomonas sp. HMWF021]
MRTIYAQLTADNKILNWFLSPQDPEYWPGIVEMQEDDQRFLNWLNPPVDAIAVQSAILAGLTQTATAQKLALADRISTLNDSVRLQLVTPEETLELPLRIAQLESWQAYAVYLGRVTGQDGWPSEVEWPEQPATGLELPAHGMGESSA